MEEELMDSTMIQRLCETTVTVTDPEGGDDPWTGPLFDLLKDNADGLDEDEWDRLVNIKRGETLTFGGGAAPLWRVTVER